MFPLLALLLLWSSVSIAQVQASTPPDNMGDPTYSCQLTLRDLVKKTTYSAKSSNNATNSWLLIRVNGDEPSKGEKGKFRKLTLTYHDVYVALSKEELPSTISLNGKLHTAKFIEKNSSGQLKKVTYSSKKANSTMSKIVVHYSTFKAETSLVEKIEYKRVNTRSNEEETKLMLSYFNYK